MMARVRCQTFSFATANSRQLRWPPTAETGTIKSPERVPGPGGFMINADKPTQWKADIAASVDHYNAWFMKFAPKTYREKRVEVTKQVQDAFVKSKDLT